MEKFSPAATVWRASVVRDRRGLPPASPVPELLAEEEEGRHVDNEQNHDDQLQPEHPPLVNLRLDDAVKLVELAQALLDTAAPLGQVKAVPRRQVHPGQVPVPEELG